MSQSELAIKAAKNRNSWGRLNARLFCVKRHVPLYLYRIACQLEAVSKGE
jgi:hypothetical protein